MWTAVGRNAPPAPDGTNEAAGGRTDVAARVGGATGTASIWDRFVLEVLAGPPGPVQPATGHGADTARLAERMAEASRSAETLRRAVGAVVSRAPDGAGAAVLRPGAAIASAGPAPLPATPALAARPRWAERGLVVATWVRNVGVVIVLFVLWQLWGTSISQHHSQRALAASFAELKRTASAPAGPAGTAARTEPLASISPPPPPAEGTVVARIQIPLIGVDQYVVEGTGESDLRKGPGHYIGTPLPGEPGNVAIAGHRTTYGAPFYDLNELVPGQDIIVSTPSGVYRYEVSQPPFPVDPGDASVLKDYGDNRLTLTTCNPRYSAAQRLIVVARPVTPLPPAPARVTHQRVRHVANRAVVADSVGWHTAHLPVALLAVALLALLGLVNTRLRRYYGRGMALALRLPLWVAGMYLLFQTLAALLPSNL